MNCSENCNLEGIPFGKLFFEVAKILRNIITTLLLLTNFATVKPGFE